MNLDKAIDDLTKFTKYCERVNWLTHGEAIKLGIEALKKWKDLKALGAYYVGGLLPGETEE